MIQGVVWADCRQGDTALSPGKTWRVTTEALLAILAWASAEKLSSDTGDTTARSCFLLPLNRPSASRARGFACDGPAILSQFQIVSRDREKFEGRMFA